MLGRKIGLSHQMLIIIVLHPQAWQLLMSPNFKGVKRFGLQSVKITTKA